MVKGPTRGQAALNTSGRLKTVKLMARGHSLGPVALRRMQGQDILEKLENVQEAEEVSCFGVFLSILTFNQ
jgi:hypothetical protein